MKTVGLIGLGLFLVFLTSIFWITQNDTLAIEHEALKKKYINAIEESLNSQLQLEEQIDNFELANMHLSKKSTEEILATEIKMLEERRKIRLDIERFIKIEKAKLYP